MANRAGAKAPSPLPEHSMGSVLVKQTDRSCDAQNERPAAVSALDSISFNQLDASAYCSDSVGGLTASYLETMSATRFASPIRSQRSADIAIVRTCSTPE